MSERRKHVLPVIAGMVAGIGLLAVIGLIVIERGGYDVAASSGHGPSTDGCSRR